MSANSLYNPDFTLVDLQIEAARKEDQHAVDEKERDHREEQFRQEYARHVASKGKMLPDQESEHEYVQMEQEFIGQKDPVQDRNEVRFSRTESRPRIPEGKE